MDMRTLSPRTVKMIVAALVVLIVGAIIYVGVMKQNPSSKTPAPQKNAAPVNRSSPPPTRPGAQANPSASPVPANTTQTAGSKTGWKTYKGDQYRFQIQVPEAYWYDAKVLSPAEKMTNGSAVLKFVVSRPAALSAKSSAEAGKTQTSSDPSKALALLTMTVFDKKIGVTVDAKKAPEGVKTTTSTEVTLGGLKGTQFGDEAYVFENANYRYEIVMTDDTSAKAIEDAFTTIVKTIKFTP